MPGLSKDENVALIRALFEIRNVVRYVFFDEAWTLYRLERAVDPHGREQILVQRLVPLAVIKRREATSWRG